MAEINRTEVTSKIPTTIVTGFLGSGKTTVISHLIDYLLDRKIKVAYIKNEIGSEDVDGKLIRGKHIDTKELLNGCICCTLTGPFYFAIAELVETVKPERIIIEASGVASPAAIALLVSSHTDIYRDGLITIIDVVNFAGYKDLSLTAREQAKLTDLVVFNKIELADMVRKQAVVGYIRELNDNVPIVEAPLGKLSPELAFGLDTRNLNRILDSSYPDLPEHLELDGISSFSLEAVNPVDKTELSEFLSRLPDNYLRVKGILKLTNGEIILVNRVGARTDIRSVDVQNNSGLTRMVFIGFNIGIQKKSVEAEFGKLSG
jgi:G3E family GTPase